MLKKVLKSAWYYALSFLVDLVQYTHSVSLTSSCLPIDEVRTIVSGQNMIDKRLSRDLENFSLGGFWREYLIKGELFC